ncbi:Plasminogen [Folsomia candida]|uniref:Plasminogen n=1 Tax=Folsomia candida TaxID=158441 RepID=A0A226DYN9_FOLCA|nr:Plasminogen [Folsomia candida]
MILLSTPIFIIVLTFALVGLSTACLKYVPDFKDDDYLELAWELACGISNEANHANTWDALIRVVEKNKKERYCGGTLINSFFVLTSHSCLIHGNLNPKDFLQKDGSFTPSDVTVWLNVKSNPFDVTDYGQNKPRAVQQVVTNAKYIVNKVMERSVTDNVALLKLKNEIDFRDPQSPKPICIFPLLKPDLDKFHLKVNVTGWVNSLQGHCNDSRASKFLLGIENEHYKDSTLKCFEKSGLIDLKDLQICKKESKGNVKDDQFCTSNLQINGMTSDGWPLIVKAQSGEIMQLGISSWVDAEFQTGNEASAHRFFTDISYIAPFTNYYSDKVGATWCQEPKHAQISRSQLSDKNSLPWEGFTSSQRILRNDSCVCGEKMLSPGRIAGGSDAKPHEFKWQVLLRMRISSHGGSSTALCGGSLINDKMILTAAHCVVLDSLMFANNPLPGIKPEDIKAYLGAHTKNGHDTDGRLVKVKAVYFHPWYIPAAKERPRIFDWDVALLELEDKVVFDKEKEMPICLPTSEEIPDLNPVGEQGWVTGWGLTNPTDGGSTATILQKIKLPIQPLEYCSRIISVEGGKPRDRVLCAGTLTQWRDSAGGDSGGPMSILRNNTFLQVGLVSYGHNSKNQTAGFYTDLRKVMSFIDFFSANAAAEWCPSKIGQSVETAEK